MEEPTYIDVGNEFDDLVMREPKWRRINNYKWNNIGLVRMALAVCGRKKFASKMEFSFFRMADKSSMPMILNPENIYAVEWLESCIDWAKKKNKPRTIIKLPALISLMKNEAKFKDFSYSWKSEHKDIVSRANTEKHERSETLNEYLSKRDNGQ